MYTCSSTVRHHRALFGSLSSSPIRPSPAVKEPIFSTLQPLRLRRSLLNEEKTSQQEPRLLALPSPSIEEALMGGKWKTLASGCRPFSSSTSKTLELNIGDALKQSRAFTQQDVLDFAKITHDFNPVHFDAGAAQSAGFHSGPIVHGMLVAGLFPRIIASYFPGAVYVSQSLQFKLPVYVDDIVIAEVKALNLRKMKDKFLAKFSTMCFKNGDIIAIDGEATAMLPTLAISRDEV